MHTYHQNTDASVPDFGTWLQHQLDRLDKRASELAADAHISKATVSMLIHGKQGGRRIQPDRDTVQKIADALGADATIALRAAGYTDGKPDMDLDFCSDVLTILRPLSEDKQQLLKDHLRETASKWASFAAA